MKDVIIIGGGMAGLVNAIRLAEAGLNVLVVEKKKYPFHRVCGEYISNEALPFLQSIGVDPEVLNPAKIKRLLISSPYGSTLELTLDMGGFGVSRYALDNYMYSIALDKGASFLFTQATDVKFENEIFKVSFSDGSSAESKIVIGSFGKRSNLDRQLNRSWFGRKSPYVAVKYHIKTDFPENLIALHNFKDGYCGITKVEEERYCLCYMTTRENLKTSGSIPEMEKNILYKNPFLKNIFQES
jgi:menaquinone-9 beta-reductase